MKTIICQLLFIVLCISVNAQIVSFSVDAEKQYDNNTKTTYLTLTGSIDNDMIVDIEREIINYPEVNTFAFYKNDAEMKCMYNVNISLSDTEIIQMINDIYDVYLNSDFGIDFPNTVYGADQKTVKFIVSGIIDEGHKQEIIETLSDNPVVVAIEINPQNICKLSVMTNVEKYMIEELFSELDLEIVVINKR